MNGILEAQKPHVKQLLFDIDDLVTVLKLPLAVVADMYHGDELPRPIMIRTSPRWRRRDIEDFVAGGCTRDGMYEFRKRRDEDEMAGACCCHGEDY